MTTTVIASRQSNPGSAGEQTYNLLISEGKLSNADLGRANQIAAERNTNVAILLVRLGFVSERDLAAAFVKINNLPALRDEDLPPSPLTNGPLSTRFLKEALLVPISEGAGELILAAADPCDDYSLHAVELATGKKVTLKVGTISQIERALNHLYGSGQSAMQNIVETLPSEDAAAGDSTERLRDLAAEAPIVRLVNLLINRAVELRASDIHIEPFENQLKIRYRIDGVLQDAESPPAHSTAAVLSRIKIMAKLNIAERRLPQDGRIQLQVQGKVIDIRVSTVPTLHGESLVLRILDKQQVTLDFKALGFAPGVLAQFEKILTLPHGIILVTGPTGSGKTTTLYTALQTLNTPERKILTVEDPIEYHLTGINQIQVKPQIGLSFATTLRSVVRQDPDIIMIGEMRDLETARIAVQSALTGHLVFSTLHTNDAGSSVTRLLDMGVEDYLLTSTLCGILAQRLVRMLCPACRTSYRPAPELVKELKLDRFAQGGELTLHRPVGCAQCGNTGYWGRMVVTELLILSDPIRRAILARADGGELQRLAVEGGMDTMHTDGLKKALAGITTIEEVTRVTQE